MKSMCGIQCSSKLWPYWPGLISGLIHHPLKGVLVPIDEDALHTAFAASRHLHMEVYSWRRKLGYLGFDSFAKIAGKGFSDVQDLSLLVLCRRRL